MDFESSISGVVQVVTCRVLFWKKRVQIDWELLFLSSWELNVLFFAIENEHLN